MRKLIIYYNFVVITLMVLAGFTSAETITELISASLFYPIFVYFSLLVLPKPKKAIEFPSVSPGNQISNQTKSKKGANNVLKLKRIKDSDEESRKFDIDRRAFIKLIGSAGMAAFIFSVFGIKKAQAAFFGSVPGPGIIGVKDSSGTRIDPSEKQPTDGYSITELDDSVPAYYGFINKEGAWFIMKEDSSGAYRYTKGASDFTNATTGWPNRTNLTYDYFDSVF